MRVACPSCNTAYNIDDAKIPATGANLKCAKCKTTFPVKHQAAAGAAVPLPGGAAPAPSAAVPLPGGAPPPRASAAVPLPGGAAPAPRASAAVPLPGGAAPAPRSAAVPLPGGAAPAPRSAAVPLPGGAPPAFAGGAVPLPGGAPPAFADGAVPLPGGAPPAPDAGGEFDPFSEAPPPPAAEPDPFGAPADAGGGDAFGGGMEQGLSNDPFGGPAPAAGDGFDPFSSAPPPPSAGVPEPDPFGAPPPQADPFGAPADASGPVGFGEIDFGGGPPPPQDPPPAEAPPPDPFGASAGGSPDFGAIDFAEPPPPPPPPAPAPDSRASGAPSPGAAGTELDFGFDEPAAPPPPAYAAAPESPPPAAAKEDLEFDPMAPAGGAPKAGDDLEADLSAPMPSAGGGGKSDGAVGDLELLDFIDDASAGKDAGKKLRSSSLRYQIKRKSGKVFGPFEQPAVVKMLEEGQLLGNEDVSSDGENWVPIGTIAAFATAIQKLMESPSGMPGLGAGGDAGGGGGGDSAGGQSAMENQQAALERMKALYGDRMAAIAVVDSAAADQKFKRRLPLIILAALVAVVAGVGLYMGTTPYGIFFTSYLFPSHLPKGSAMYAKFLEAQKALNEDTFEGYNRVMADAKALLEQKRSAVESRALFAQAVFYLKRRYYAGDENIKQAKGYIDELVLSTKDDVEVVKARAGQHILLGEEAQIRPALESAIAKPQNRDDVELLHLLAESYLRERNTGPAMEALKRALAVDSKNPKALHMMGLVKTLEKSPDYQAAVENYSKALDVDPRHLSSAVEIAAIKLQKQDDPEGAVDALRKALGEDAKKILAPSDLARAHYLQGMMHASRHQKDEALKEFEQALKIYPESAPAKAAFGRFLLRRHDYQRAVELFEAAFKADKKEIDYLDGYVRSLLGSGKQVQANKAIADSVGSFPGNPRISFLQGRVADELEKGLDAESNYKRANDADKTLWEPAYYLGRFYLNRKRVDEAKKWFAEGLTRAPNNPDTHTGEGSARLASGELPAAKTQFLTALKLDPENSGGHFGLAQVLVLEGSLEDARKEFEAVQTIDPRVPKLYTEYGRLLWSLKDFDASAKALEKAKEADPRDALASWSLGAVLYEWSKALGTQEKFAEALKNLEGALTIEPIGDAYFYKAKIHYDKRENNQAIDSIKAALERASQNPQYHNLRGAIMYQAGKFVEAVDSWQTAVKIKPDYADAIEALGRGYQEQGNWNLAIESFEKALTVDPKRTGLLVNIGDCLLNGQNDYDRTIKKYEEALRANPNQVGVYYKIGRCYDSKGKTEKAIQYYKQAIDKDPDAKEAWRFLGYAYKEQNRKADACKAFQKYRDVSPDAGDLKEIENEIFDLGCKDADKKPGKGGKPGHGEPKEEPKEEPGGAPPDEKPEGGAAE
ncbi:MAG TPA: tetratricopeptide repeat protein [Myxococcales bacterium]|jgi:predicted Zn finger-like uncharacterized protein